MIGFVIGGLGIPELLIILVILLLLFGARRLPDLAKGLGQSVRAFKQGISENQLEDKHTKAVDSGQSTVDSERTTDH
jgi:sec-independent protein translocase protein TatA